MTKNIRSGKNIQNTLKRVNLVKNVQKETGFSAAQSAQLVNEIFENISNALIQGEDVKLANFGTFKLRDKAERIGRNPKTNADVLIAPRKVVTFKPSNLMKERVNSALSKAEPNVDKIARSNTKNSGHVEDVARFDVFQWKALFELLGMVTLANSDGYEKKVLAFTNACIELKTIINPSAPITKNSAKKWLDANSKTIMQLTRNEMDDRSLYRTLRRLDSATCKLDIICTMVHIATANNHYGRIEQTLIKKTILDWNIPAVVEDEIDYVCAEKIMKVLRKEAV